MSSFGGMIQVYSDETATLLKADTIKAYPVHVLLVNLSRILFSISSIKDKHLQP